MCSSTSRTQEAGRVGVVDHDRSIVPVSQVADGVQPGDGSIHREDPVGGDQAQTSVRSLLEFGFEVLHVAAGEPQPARLAQTDAVDDARVVQFIAEDRVLRTQKGLEHTAVGVEARTVEDGVLRAQELAEPSLQLLVQLLGATDEPDGTQTVAPSAVTRQRSVDDSGVVGEPQVVVRTEVQHLSAADHGDPWPLRTSEDALLFVPTGIANLPQFIFQACLQ